MISGAKETLSFADPSRVSETHLTPNKAMPSLCLILQKFIIEQIQRRTLPVEKETQSISEGGTKQSTAKSMQQSKYSTSTEVSSRDLLQQMSESKHAPGIRRPGCPCCEPDSAATYADNMML